MSQLPQNVSQSTRRRNPHLYFDSVNQIVARAKAGLPMINTGEDARRRQSKPLLNKLESRYCTILEAAGFQVLKQAITLRLDPPYKSYRPDLAYWGARGLQFIEVKGPHRFRKAGIAKAALAAKTYPQFKFVLADWADGQWKESVLSS